MSVSKAPVAGRQQFQCLCKEKNGNFSLIGVVSSRENQLVDQTPGSSELLGASRLPPTRPRPLLADTFRLEVLLGGAPSLQSTCSTNCAW